MKIKCSFLAVSFLFLITHLHAQSETKGLLKGRVADTTLQQVLKQATISILNAKDSSLVMYGLTDDKGLFVQGNIDMLFRHRFHVKGRTFFGTFKRDENKTIVL